MSQYMYIDDDDDAVFEVDEYGDLIGTQLDKEIVISSAHFDALMQIWISAKERTSSVSITDTQGVTGGGDDPITGKPYPE